ncbi:antibiotic biosynthesis monooxygenase [Dactylosporangium sp. NPDC051484]|uniref:antibiotic biosynthesis monooxygenase family protein n=1 Tax=Dactylosporangium sp. NPDC051484 TaxID=3154942 RepID=UPI00344DE86B
MTTLHIDLVLEPDHAEPLVRAFQQSFVPAVSIQEGFRSVRLLAPADGESNYRISLEFETEELRQKWVASQEHGPAWDAIVESIASFSTALFDEVGTGNGDAQ